MAGENGNNKNDTIVITGFWEELMIMKRKKMTNFVLSTIVVMATALKTLNFVPNSMT